MDNTDFHGIQHDPSFYCGQFHECEVYRMTHDIMAPNILDLISTLCAYLLSSHEHKVLKVSCWDQSMSAVGHCLQFALNDNFYSTGPNLIKLHRNDP